MDDSWNVEIPVGTLAMKASFAAPALPPGVEGGSHPAVIVLQESFGVNAEMRRITELLAEAGYAAMRASCGVWQPQARRDSTNAVLRQDPPKLDGKAVRRWDKWRTPTVDNVQVFLT